MAFNFGPIAVSDEELRGVWALLSLCAKPRSDEAQAFLAQVVQAREDALAAEKRAEDHHAGAQEKLDAIAPREAAVTQREQEVQVRSEAAAKLQQDYEHRIAQHKAVGW